MPETIDYARYELEFDADFSGPDLDPAQWLPHYLPQWSSRHATRARYDVGDGLLTLRVDADQPPWSVEYDGPVRVSNLQTGVRSGPVGSGEGQHPFRDGLVVREAQREQRLYTPRYGVIEVRAAASSDPHSMVALWMIGIEDVPEHSAEICVMEIFGNEVTDASALVGMGVHPFNDPAITDDFEKVRVELDVRDFHDYAVEWMPGGVRFFIDGQLVRSTTQSPDYPMQLMLDVFHFPPDAGDAGAYPKEFHVQRVRGFRLR
ncbi:glycoside hydrolase family 16 protein [Agromyces sp. ISL-38]|uniref:glycoside hydrolase family 16 protein n=1 Tax=Agromyces sp. ISL-38 TaxID=2819107 RepID=UPI001BE8A45D|nr:glycoside hydrolase family 16 protein [Agromyces sp. ISL-38]MBT2519151.1 glycoside hydrolase family 16 protein [Streptomyces sp. ISL-90]